MAVPKGLYAAHMRNAEAGGNGTVDSYTERSRVRGVTDTRNRGLEAALSYPIVDADKELSEFYEQI